MTYQELVEAVERTAGGLHARGLRRGDVAALCSSNRVEFAVAFLATARLGAATTLVNPSFTEPEMARQLADSDSVVAFASPEVVEKVRAAGGGRLREIYVFGAADGAVSFASLSAGGPAREIDVNPDEVVALPYSSGTSGTPKGVQLTHRNLVAMQMQMLPVEGTRPGDVVIAVLPFFHIYGLSVILVLGLYRGATIVVFERFRMDAFLTAIDRHRATRLPLVPPLILRLAREPSLDRFDLSSVRTVISGAAPLPAEVGRELGQRLGCFVKQGYGMTELSPGGHMHPEDGNTPPEGSVGLLHPNTECRLVDPVTGVDVGPGETGEIWYRGPQVMAGYLGRPEDTAAILSSDGWLRTGDIGRIDAEGYLYVVDRLKEMIKFKGFQVAPAELEALLLTHPSIADAAVIPSPDEEAGEVPKALVVLAPGAVATDTDIMEFVAARVAHYKQVRAVELVEEIPRSPSGKILRRLLVERERARGEE